jgi:alcohol dehydrogenase
MAYRRWGIPRLYVGEGALDALAEIEAARAFVVADPLMARLPHAERVRTLLAGTGAEVQVWDGVDPDPNRATVERAAAAMRAFAPDLVVGLGGGSAIDVAKAAWVFYEHPDLAWEQAVTFFALPPLRARARLVTIPTTSGTGSEVSYAAMVTNEHLEPRFKECLLGFDLAADIAIIDGTLCVTMPPSVTADTGFDVLSHTFESYVSNFAHDLTYPLAAGATKLVFRWLPVAYRDGANVEARQHMHNASALAGMAMASAALGICHSLAHQLGTLFHIPHGRACAYTLGQTIAFNAPAARDGYAALARDIGVAGEPIGGLIAALDALKQEIGIASALRDTGIAEDAWHAALPQMVAMAARDGNRPSNPRPYDDDDLHELFVRVWEGT